jgi:DNA polymerase
MTRLYLDLETYSPVPIAHGTHAYAERAQVMLFAWALDDGPVSVWDATAESDERMPDDVFHALTDDGVEVWAHNSHFDRTVLRHAGSVVERTAARAISRWRDTMVKAMCHGLPGSLGDLCEILKVEHDEAKDKDGRALIHLFCKPRPDGSRATSRTHPEQWARFKRYAALDISAMRAVDAKLPTWNYRGAELALWHRDQAINDRGVAVDADLARGAVAAVAQAQKVLGCRTQDLTDGALDRTTQRDKLLAHILAEYGVQLPDTQAATIERRIADPDLPAELRELLALRLQASSTSTSKYAALLRGISADGRLRGTLQYSGAQRTRRWAGRLFQPQNLKRPDLPQADIDTGIAAIKAGCADLITDNVMRLVSNAVRGCLVAPTGRKLVVSDLSNIEGRVAAWLAGERWKLRAFAEFDAGDGPDLYRLAYAKAFAIKPDEVGKDQRQIGKVMELMLQYEGGVGAFITGADAYSIDLASMAERAWDSIPRDVLAEAEGFWEWTKDEGRSTYGLAHEVFVVCDSLKRLWRRAHPLVTALWKELRDSACRAVQLPGQTVTCGKFKMRRDGNWLRILLPSGNYLCYPAPEVKDGALTYMGVNQYTRKWSRLGTYGGKLFENACQSLARDVMAHNMPAIEDARFDIVLTVHDEVITEADDTPEFNTERLSALLATCPPWAEGLPLAAGGFEGYRYRKE